MNTAIISSQEFSLNGVDNWDYAFRLRGPIFTSDIDQLGHKLAQILGDQTTTQRSILMDLINADSILFKPTRFFGMCKYFANYIRKNSLNNTRVVLRISEEQKQWLPNFDDIHPIELVVADPHEDNILYDSTSLDSALLLGVVVKEPSQNMMQSGSVKKFDIQQLLPIWDRTLFYRFCVLVMILCCALLVLSINSFPNTLFGFALSFSSGILFFEALIVAIALRRHQKT